MVEIEGQNDDDNLECDLQEPQCTHINMKDYAARWILKTCGSRYLTRMAMLGVINDVTDMIHVIVENVRHDIHQLLLQHDIDIGYSWI